MPLTPPLTPTAAAVLDPQERSRVDAAGSGCFVLIHRESVRDAIRVVRERPVDAILVSVRRCAGEAPALLEQFSRAFPAIPTVALVTQREPGDAEALLRLGATGVRQVVDATDHLVIVTSATDPVNDLRGLLRGGDSLIDALMDERRAERARE